MICHATAPKTLPQHIPRKLQHLRWRGCPRRKRFASAHPAQIATLRALICSGQSNFASAHPAQIATLRPAGRRAAAGLCLSTSRANCNESTYDFSQLTDLCLSTSRANCNFSSAASRCRRCGFASAHPAQIATPAPLCSVAICHLCLSTSRANCNLTFCTGLCTLSHFASAHPAQIATAIAVYGEKAQLHFASAHPAQIATGSVCIPGTVLPLCLSTSRANCNFSCALTMGKNAWLCLSTSRANCNGEKHKCFFI